MRVPTTSVSLLAILTECALLLLLLLHTAFIAASAPESAYQAELHQYSISPGFGVNTSTRAIFRVKRQADIRGPYTADEKKTLLDHHNKLRGLVKAADMLTMEWDDDLATEAQRWADLCDFNHPQGQREVGEFTSVGQNLYVGSADSPKVTDPVQLWYDEVVDYTYSDDMTCTPMKMCGHYTQVIWAKSKAVGCAVQYCKPLTSVPTFSEGYLVVCEYGPAGNYRGQFPYVKGNVCSKCPAEYKYCANNRCSLRPAVGGASSLHPHPLTLLVKAMSLAFLAGVVSVAHKQ